jgi:hypothetical protein
VEQGALALSSDALLADEGRFATLRIDAYHLTAIAVDALRTVLNRFTHYQYNT